MSKKLTAKERARRDVQNKRYRERTRKLRRRGLCRCRRRLDKNPKTGRNYTLCAECREKSRRSANRYYREGKLAPRPRPEIKFDRRLKDQVGLRRRFERDGLGREDWWWVVNLVIDGKPRSTRFSIAKHGDMGAFQLARKKRDEWESER